MMLRICGLVNRFHHRCRFWFCRYSDGWRRHTKPTDIPGHSDWNPKLFEGKTGMRKISIVLLLFLAGCVRIPNNVKPVDDFRLERYVGKWYEIARLDHSFERGLTRVTADYSLLHDGSVKVLNRGYSEKEKKWKEAEGRAYFVKGRDQGYLKVSFFGPFYGSYIIFELDHDSYQYSLVCGPDKTYLWVLARSPGMKKELKDMLVAKAATLGFDTSKLIFLEHQ
jgi:apolipoprotein D and lipocalin family protein